MLMINAEIVFFKTEEFANNDGICSKSILRPAFNFGDDFLFSGTIVNDSMLEKYLYQKEYKVKVEFPTIEKEAYNAIAPLIKIGMYLKIQNASRVIGEAKLLNYKYKE